MLSTAISYRRAESGGVVGRIYDRLTAKFGEENVFVDVDAIPFGVDFRDHIIKVFKRTDVLIVVIGPSWLGVQPDQTKRIDEPNDPVRVEVRTALQDGSLLVIPVLINDTRMPSVNNMPEDIQALAYRHAARIDEGRGFNHDMGVLLMRLVQHESNLEAERARADQDRAEHEKAELERATHERVEQARDEQERAKHENADKGDSKQEAAQPARDYWALQDQQYRVKPEKANPEREEKGWTSFYTAYRASDAITTNPELRQPSKLSLNNINFPVLLFCVFVISLLIYFGYSSSAFLFFSAALIANIYAIKKND